MGDTLEFAVRGWEVNVPEEGSEQFQRSIVQVLEKTGFVRGEKYWENAGIGGLRLYSIIKHTGCCTETIGLSIKSPSVLDGIPPVVTLIEQVIYHQKYNSIKIIQ